MRFEGKMESKRKYQVCTNCVMDTSDSKIVFDSNGVCDHCLNYYRDILPTWNYGQNGKSKLEKIVKQIKHDGKNKEYDCIIGISGGVDSSYLLYHAKEILGLRPLAYSVDTGWNLNVAVSNIENLVNGLNLNLYTEIINWREMRDLQLAFFKSQVAYQDLPQDHVIFAGLYNHAVKNGIKHVLTGGNFATESIREPIEWVYQNDIRMIKDIQKKYGAIKIKSLPLTGMFKYKLYYRFIKGMKVHRPLDLITYNKESVVQTLQSKFNWKPYQNKHFESIFTRFYEGYWLPKKFGFDKRRAHYSSLILSKQITRNDALKLLKETPYDDRLAGQDLDYICQKLNVEKATFIELMSKPNKTYQDYKNSSFWISLAVKIARILKIETRQYR